jgi:hypothetical protein
VLARYNWNSEADKLAAFYERLLARTAAAPHPAPQRQQAGGISNSSTL